MTVLDVVRFMRANVRMLLAALGIGLLLAVGWTALQPVRYTASATGYVVAGGSATVSEAMQGGSLAASKAASYASLATSRGVAERVQAATGTSGSYTGSADSSSGIMTFTATAPSREEAQTLANALVRATADEALALETLTSDPDAGGEIDRSAEPTGTSAVRLVPLDDATLPGSPSSPDWRLNLALGALVGIVGGVAVALLRRALDVRVRAVTDLEEITGVSNLGTIPKTDELAGKTASSAGGPAAEALRHLRTNLRFVDVDHPPRAIVFTSANAQEGKSTVSANVARTLAAAGQPTVIIDADLRRPTLAKRFGIDGHVGLTQVLAGDLPVADALVESGTSGLSLLPAGRIPPNPSELVGSKRMRDLIGELAHDHMVIVDAPPLLPVTDAGLLGVASDGVIVVARYGGTMKEQARLTAKLLKQVDARLLGTVLNLVPTNRIGSAMYGYGYGYGYSPEYYYSGDEKKRGRGRKRVAAPENPVDNVMLEPAAVRSAPAPAAPGPVSPASAGPGPVGRASAAPAPVGRASAAPAPVGPASVPTPAPARLAADAQTPTASAGPDRVADPPTETMPAVAGVDGAGRGQAVGINGASRGPNGHGANGAAHGVAPVDPFGAPSAFDAPAPDAWRPVAPAAPGTPAAPARGAEDAAGAVESPWRRRAESADPQRH